MELTKKEIEIMIHDVANATASSFLTDMINYKRGLQPLNLENCTGDAQLALSEEGGQTMAKNRIRICADFNDDGTPVLKQVSIKGSTEWERHEEAFKRIAETPRGQAILAELGFCREQYDRPVIQEIKPVMTFEEYSEKWLKNNLNINANSKSTYRKVLEADINPFFGEKNLSDIVIDDILTFFSGLAEDDYSKSMGNTCKTIIKQVLQCSVTDGFIKVNPAADPRVKNPCIKKTEREPLTEKQWSDVVHQIHDKLFFDDRLYMYLVAYTAARRGEVLALRYEDFDFENLKLTISRNVTFPDGYNPNVGAPKGKKTATIPLARELTVELKERFKDCPKEGFLFHRDNDYDKPYTSGMFWQMWQRIRATIDLYGATSQTFRHTVCTLLSNKKVDLKTISAIARHAQTSTTANIYIHANEEKSRAAMDLLSANVA